MPGNNAVVRICTQVDTLCNLHRISCFLLLCFSHVDMRSSALAEAFKDQAYQSQRGAIDTCGLRGAFVRCTGVLPCECDSICGNCGLIKNSDSHGHKCDLWPFYIIVVAGKCSVNQFFSFEQLQF